MTFSLKKKELIVSTIIKKHIVTTPVRPSVWALEKLAAANRKQSKNAVIDQ